MRRELDGVYFRIGKENVCFSDLNEQQQDEVMNGRSELWLKSLCKILAKKLREIGDQFDIVARMGNDGEN